MIIDNAIEKSLEDKVQASDNVRSTIKINATKAELERHTKMLEHIEKAYKDNLKQKLTDTERVELFWSLFSDLVVDSVKELWS